MKRIGIDVGGTFTDVVVLDEESGTTRAFKAATNYDQPANGILQAFDAAGVNGQDVSHIKIGTTLGINALLTRQGAPTGLLTTQGFRDVLEIRRTHRDRLFDLAETVPPPLVPRRWRKEVVERVSNTGEVVTPLDEESVREAWLELRGEGVTALAICFLFSFRNPAHEQRARDIVMAEGGADAVFISSEVLPVIREYERTSTTTVAAFVAPVVRDFVDELALRLSERGVPRERLSVMTNSGGTLAAKSASKAPVPTLLSGPAGGVSGARWLAEAVGFENVLTLDMGGTSCDVSGVQAGVPDERLDMRVGGQDVAYPTFDIHTIGAGGGSIAWIDSGGALRVGPASAGSTPGPASYGRGGTLPTVTDANLVLGRYSPDTPIGGSLLLDLEAARSAIRQEIAEPLGMSVERAAAGILRLVNANMVNAVRTISVERGRDPRSYALVPFGGGGPVHSMDIAEELGISTVVVPPFPGCTSAFGATLSLPRRDALRSINRDVATLPQELVTEVVRSLTEEVTGLLESEGYPSSQLTLELWGNLHYRGQAHELAVRHDGLDVTGESLKALAVGFSETHQRQYGHSFADVPVDLVTIRVTGYAAQASPPVVWDWAQVQNSMASSSRPVYFELEDDFLDAEIVERASMAVGATLTGPAVIYQSDATVLVPPNWIAHVHASGNLLVRRGSSGN